MIDERVACQQFFQRPVGEPARNRFSASASRSCSKRSTRVRRRGALQVFEGGPFELPVLGMQGAERDPNRILGQQQREQREEMLQVAVGAALHLVVEEPILSLRIAAVEQTMALPYGLSAGTTRG